jgi:microcystin synthetase protein McyG
LRGAVHAAGILDDGVLTQLTVERLRRVTAAKIAGAWNLHLLTRDRPLDLFMLYASAVSLFGTAGQANHAAANAFLDALAAFRRSHGLPGLSIDWGPWSEAGAAVDHGVLDRLGSRGFGPISNAAGITALARALAEPEPQIGIVPIDWQRFLEARPPWPFVADFRPAMQQPAARRPLSPAVLDRVRTALPEDRHQQIADAVAAAAARVLGHNDLGRIDRQAGFFDIGLDSLTTVELRVLLQNALSVALPATVAFDYPTVHALASHLHGRLFPDSVPEAGVAALSADDVEAELRRELEELRY